MQAGQSASERTDPDIALPIFVERPHLIVRETLFRGVNRQRAVVQPEGAAIRAQPHAAVTRGHERPDYRARKSVLEDVEPSVLEKIQTIVGAHPEESLPVFHQRVDVVVRQSIFAAEMRKLSVMQTAHAAALEPGPQISVMRFEHRAHDGMSRPKRIPEDFRLAVFPTVQRAARPRPQAAVLAGPDRPETLAGESFGCADGEKFSRAETVQGDSTGRAHPEVAFSVLVNGLHGVAGESLIFAVDANSMAIQPIQAAIERSNPKIVVAVLEEALNQIAGKPILRGEGLDCTVFQPADSLAIDANPNAAVVCLHDGDHSFVVRADFDANEPAIPHDVQAARRANPEVALRIDQQGPHLVGVQAVFRGVRGEAPVLQAIQAAVGSDPKAAVAPFAECANDAM